MSYIAVKQVDQSDDPGADRTYETDSESLMAVSEIVDMIDGLDNGQALIIWKEIF